MCIRTTWFYVRILPEWKSVGDWKRFWVVILGVPEVQRCRSQHRRTWAEYAHARTSSQHSVLSGYSSRFFLFFFWTNQKVFLLAGECKKRQPLEKSCKTEPRKKFDEVDQTHLQHIPRCCVTELILYHKKPFFKVSKQWHIQAGRYSN